MAKRGTKHIEKRVILLLLIQIEKEQAQMSGFASPFLALYPPPPQKKTRT
jgi:hypothetical protein